MSMSCELEFYCHSLAKANTSPLLIAEVFIIKLRQIVNCDILILELGGLYENFKNKS